MNKIILLLIVGLFVALNGCNQLGIPSNNAVLIVDMTAVAKATGRQEVMQKELEFANIQLTEQLKLIVSHLEENVTEEKEKLGKKPTPEEQRQFDILVLQAQKQLQDTKNLAVQQSTEFRSELILDFRNEVSNIAQQIANKQGSKLVMVVGQETLWFDSNSDITDEVIAIMRERDNDLAGSRILNVSESSKNISEE